MPYNDQMASPAEQLGLVECVVCHDTTSPSEVHWHTIRLDRPFSEDYPQGYVELLLPICFSCADLFHDVAKPTRRSN